MKSRKEQLRGNIWKFYVYQILRGIFFSVPVMVLFWQENGLSLTEIMILQSFFSISVVLLEIPTGYIADVFNRKNIITLASFLGFIGMFFYSIGDSFFDFLLAELFFAFSISFVSGTMSALVYDTLIELGIEKEYKKIWGKALFYGMLALAISGILGAFIAKTNLRYTLCLSVPFFFLLGPLSYSIKEPERDRMVMKKDYFSKTINVLKNIFKEKFWLKWLIIYSGIIFAFVQAAFWLYQPYFKISGLDIVYFGLVFAGFQIVSAFASKYAYKIEEKLSRKYSLLSLIFLVAISYLLMSNFVFLFSFVFCFIQQFVRGFRNTVVSDYINQMVTSDIRATVLSIESFVGRLIYALILPFVGWTADVYSLTQALMMLGIFSILIALGSLFVFKKVNSN